MVGNRGTEPRCGLRAWSWPGYSRVLQCGASPARGRKVTSGPVRPTPTSAYGGFDPTNGHHEFEPAVSTGASGSRILSQNDWDRRWSHQHPQDSSIERASSTVESREQVIRSHQFESSGGRKLQPNPASRQTPPPSTSISQLACGVLCKMNESLPAWINPKRVETRGRLVPPDLVRIYAR